jgi:alcohol dehydrogenase
MAITHTGTSLPHGLSYAFTYEQGYSHGKAVGMFLAGFVSMYKDKQESQEVMALLGFEDVFSFQEYMLELLGQVDVDGEVLKSSVQKILGDAGKLKNFPFDVTEQELLEMPRKTCRILTKN